MRIVIGIGVVVIIALVVGCASTSIIPPAETPPAPLPEPTSESQPTPAPTPAPSSSPEPTPSPTPETIPESTPMPTPTPEPLQEPEPAPVSEPTPEPTHTPTPEIDLKFLPAYLPITHNIEFTAVDDDIEWTSGTITCAEGTQFSVNAGSLHLENDNFYYLYYQLNDPDLKHTQTFANATSSERILITFVLKN